MKGPVEHLDYVALFRQIVLKCAVYSEDDQKMVVRELALPVAIRELFRFYHCDHEWINVNVARLLREVLMFIERKGGRRFLLNGVSEAFIWYGACNENQLIEALK